MCDCYEHPCSVRGCKETIPWHIGDFKFPREDFKMWCHKHIYKSSKNAVIFSIPEPTYRDKNHDYYDKDEIFPGWRCAVIGPELEPDGDNHVNSATDVLREDPLIKLIKRTEKKIVK